MRSLQREMFRYGRGRPQGQRRSMAEADRLWYLIRVSEKYGLEPRRFLVCFLDAWLHNKSSYDDILIQLRQKTDNDGIFLVTQGQKVIAQLRLTEALLRQLPDIDLSRFQTLSVKKTKPAGAVDVQIKDVKSGIKWVNLNAKVTQKSSNKGLFSRFGNHLVLSTATISDETGSIKLSLWNDQVNTVSIGDMIHIQNGRVSRFRGELQVSVGRIGKLTVINPLRKN